MSLILLLSAPVMVGRFSSRFLSPFVFGDLLD
jgi:hypothetical protein